VKRFFPCRIPVVRFEDFTMVKIEFVIFWVAALCIESQELYLHCGETLKSHIRNLYGEATLHWIDLPETQHIKQPSNSALSLSY